MTSLASRARDKSLLKPLGLLLFAALFAMAGYRLGQFSQQLVLGVGVRLVSCDRRFVWTLTMPQAAEGACIDVDARPFPAVVGTVEWTGRRLR
jgi:hypothetical protein